MIRQKCRVTEDTRGFSLIEVLTVVVIIGIVGAFVAPMVLNYLRSYRIQGAANRVAGEIQTARIKAISKNVNLGVMFGLSSNTAYGWTIEDDLDPAVAPNWTTINTEPWTTLADPASGQTPGPQTLPPGLIFDDPASCRGGGAATDFGFRFRRLGMACAFSSPGCPAPPVPAALTATLIQAAAGEFRLCLFHADSSQRWTVRVTSSGRIITEQGNP